MYIDHERIYKLLEDGKKATREDINKILEKARKKKVFLIMILLLYYN